MHFQLFIISGLLPHFTTHSNNAFILKRIGTFRDINRLLKTLFENNLHIMWGIVGNCVLLNKFSILEV